MPALIGLVFLFRNGNDYNMNYDYDELLILKK